MGLDRYVGRVPHAGPSGSHTPVAFFKCPCIQESGGLETVWRAARGGAGESHD